MTSNTPAFTPLKPRIHEASTTGSYDDRDLTKLVRIYTADSRSNPLTRCMLRQPDSDTDREQYARYNCITALERANFNIFIAQIPHDLGELLGSVFIERRSITDSFASLELPDFINKNVYKHVHFRAEGQRRLEMKRDYYSILVQAAKPNLPTRNEFCENEIRKDLATFAVDKIRKIEPDRDIVAQTTESKDYDNVFPAAEGWEKVGYVVVMDSAMLDTLEEKQRSLRMFVNRGRRGG